jgi:predicted metal-dependent peptidase
VDPATVLVTPPEQIGWWLLHQVGHLVRRHASRSPVRPEAGTSGPLHAPGLAGPRNAEAHRWNQAADAEINDDLEIEGLPGPGGTISPTELGLPTGRLAEEYVPMLDVLDDAVSRGGRVLAAAVDCGGGCDGIDRRWETSGSSTMTELDRELLERSLAASIQDHARARNVVPSGWRRWADERLRPRVNWQARMSALIRRGFTEVAGRVDFSYRRPSRRAGAHPHVVTPSMVRPIPETVVVLDTSGSVSKPLLTHLVSEVAGVLDKIGDPRRRLRVVCCDAKAHPVQEVRRAEEIELVGGGGTDMRAGIEAAVALRPRPDLVIVLTDGETPWPPHRPHAKVIVGLVGEAGIAPEWASAVHIPKAEGSR